MAFRGDWRLFLPVCSPAEKGIRDRSFVLIVPMSPFY